MKETNTVTAFPGNVYTYYDLLAMLCNFVSSLDSKDHKELCRYAADFSKCVRIAADMFPSLSMKLLSRLSGHAVLEMSVISEILTFVSSATLEGWAIVLGIIGNIDTAIALDNNLSIVLEGRNRRVVDEIYDGVSESYFEFEALNGNTENIYGSILPRLYCEWRKESDRTIDTVGLDPLAFALKNYLWIRKDNQWKITNLYCDFRKVGLNNGLLDREAPFKIVSSPLSKQAPFCVTLDKENNLFYVKYLPQDDMMLKRRIQTVIDYAIGERADIVMFPEMMGTSGCIQFCKGYISECFSVWKPKLFLLPTWEHEEEGKWCNTLYGLDENGECIFKYNKQNPFVFDLNSEPNGEKIKYFEPIQPDEEIYVIHVPGIGRIGLIICSDIFDKNYLDRLFRDLKITLLLYPVFSSGKDLMERFMALATTYSCDMLFCNTCAAWDNTLVLPEDRQENNSFDCEFVGIYNPRGHMKYKDTDIIKEPVVECRGTECQGCLFVTILAKKYRGPSFASRKIRLEEI